MNAHDIVNLHIVIPLRKLGAAQWSLAMFFEEVIEMKKEMGKVKELLGRMQGAMRRARLHTLHI